MSEQHTKIQLRSELRQRRRALLPSAQQQAAEKLLNKLQSLDLLPASNDNAHVYSSFGCYLAQDGEINLTPTIQWLWQHDQRVYLPVITHEQQLAFYRYTPETVLAPNQYGIPEPVEQVNTVVYPEIIFLPLVAFDQQGGRLGMGGGFYDRTLASCIALSQHKPLLIGIAHHCQQVRRVPVATWDIALDMVVTDQAVYQCS